MTYQPGNVCVTSKSSAWSLAGRFECPWFFCFLFHCFCLCFPGRAFLCSAILLRCSPFDESLASCKAAKLLQEGGIFQDFDARMRILVSDSSLFKLSVANRQKSANYWVNSRALFIKLYMQCTVISLKICEQLLICRCFVNRYYIFVTFLDNWIVCLVYEIWKVPIWWTSKLEKFKFFCPGFVAMVKPLEKFRQPFDI